jgi:integrating conjugative element protein (TIGR03757 family)
MMISRWLLVSLFLWTGSMQADSSSDLLRVTYIGSNTDPLENEQLADDYDIQLTAYNIDAHRNLEKELSANLPSNLAEAERIANERLKRMDGQRLQDAFKGVALTIQWDLQKVPALVFGDGEAVIYGVADLEEGLRRYRYFRMRQ